MRFLYFFPILILTLGACKRNDPEPTPVAGCQPLSFLDSAGSIQQLFPWQRFQYDQYRRLIQASDAFRTQIWNMEYRSNGRLVLQAYRNDGRLNPYLGHKEVVGGSGGLMEVYSEYTDLNSPIGNQPLARDTLRVIYASKDVPTRTVRTGLEVDSIFFRALKYIFVTNYTYYADGTLASIITQYGNDATSLHVTDIATLVYDSASPAVTTFPLPQAQLLPGMPFAPIRRVPARLILQTYNAQGQEVSNRSAWFRPTVDAQGYVTHLSMWGDAATVQARAAVDIPYQCSR